ncbi:10357_t:CDS:2 [Scutellospora calospora]|uniref:10357_t:CDS:1 n=1 Tax=Scutellospora calospora TaxID=85575 RepID=A0ACA9K0K5_9GLOM|nr:10357_t:CDS:2 [Scutellospora calospora]
MAGLFAFDRHDLTAVLAEFLGTAYFLFMGVGGAIAFGSSSIAGIGIPFSFGWSLMVNVFLWAPISGGVLNPAITIGLMATRSLKLIRGLLYIIAQLLGALLGSFLIKVLLPGDPNGATVLGPNTSVAQGFFLEMFATSVLTFAVLFMAIEKHAVFMAPFVIGISLFISALAIFGNYGNGHWIYYFGPTAGSLLAAGYWYLFTKLDYKKASGGDKEDEEFNFNGSKPENETNETNETMA